MTTIRTILTLGLMMPLLGAVSAAAAACPELENKKPELRLAYLQGERTRLDPNCILFAIQQLGLDHYAPAIKTLIAYLDYREPPQKDGSPIFKTLAPLVPAGDALFGIGKPAVPQLASTIAEAATSDAVRNNAGDTVFAIYREDVPEGIAALVRAAHANTDPVAAIHLMDQARRQASRCGPDLRNACENETLK